MKGKGRQRKRRGALPYVLIGVILASAIGAFSLSLKGADDKSELPAFAKINVRTQTAYLYALENQQILEKIPCYCGCYVPVAMHGGFEHKNNKNCFIKDDGSWVKHGSECDVCVYIALDVKKGLAQGSSIKQVRDSIDAKYGRNGAPPTRTPPLDEQGNFVVVGLSKYSLPENFRSLSDGLKLTPREVYGAQFINVKAIYGTSLEAQGYARVQSDSFYGKKIIGMYSADYNESSWIELHDLGYADANVMPRAQEGVENIVTTRPFIYGHTENVKGVLEIMENPGITSAYETFKPLLEKVNDEEAGIAFAVLEKSDFSDMEYLGLRSLNMGSVERVSAYRMTDESILSRAEELRKSAAQRGFSAYEVKTDGEVLVIRMVSDLGKVLSEEIG